MDGRFDERAHLEQPPLQFFQFFNKVTQRSLSLSKAARDVIFGFFLRRIFEDRFGLVEFDQFA